MSNEGDKNTIISTQVITASLTMITVIGAFAVFIIEKREIGIHYYLITGAAFFCFVISIFFGGRGLSWKGADAGAKKIYNLQAITAFLGIILFCVSVFFGTKKPEDLESKVYEQGLIIIELKTKDDFRANEARRLNDKLDKLTKQIDEISKSTLPRENLSKTMAKCQ